MAKTIGSFDLASLKNLRDDVTQYFWFESDSSSAWGSGAHVTLYPESQFTDSTNPNYMKGQNIIMNTDGFSIRNGGLPMMVLDNDSLDFNAVDTSLGTYVTMATFGLTGATIGQTSGAHIQISSSGFDVSTNSSTNIASFGIDGARIGQNDGAHSVIDADGMRIYGGNSGLTILANIGYANGSPYYSFGRRLTTQNVYSPTSRYLVGDMCLYDDGSGQKLYVCKVETPFGGEAWNSDHWQDAIGLYSFSENGTAVNIGNAASGFGSHAEGRSTVAVGSNSHTEGRDTIASDQSHAEGYASKALGNCSHAEGWSTNARGGYSHSQNYATEATKQAQTALGSFNKSDVSSTTTHPSGNVDYGRYAVIVGNGSSSVNRSNALTIDWAGNVEAAGEFITRQTTLNLGVYVASGVLTSNAGLLTFSIPTGRVFPSGTTISKMTFDILVRASSANGTGYYIIESTTTSSDVASFDSSTSKTFHNANDATQTITSAMWTKELYGGTNIYIAFSGGTDFFSGTTTIRNYINNNAAVIYLSNIVVTLSIPST